MDLIYSFFLEFFTVNIAYADGVDDFISNVNRLILNPLIGLMFAVALVVFFYGVVEFLMNADQEEARTLGKKHMMWGVIGLFIMMSVWAVLNLVLGTFGIDKNEVNPEKGTVNLKPYDKEIILK